MTDAGPVRPRSAATFVGRDGPLASLCEAVERGGSVVFVEGEAGVGKSRLVAETRALVERHQVRVLVGHCQPHRDPLPLLPVLDALRDVGPVLPSLRLSPLAGALRPMLPELAGLLPPSPEPLGDPPAERYRVFRALRELFGALGRIVLVLEDMHWSDEMSLELLRFLAGDVPANLSVVCTHRDEQVPQHAVLRGIAARRGGAPLIRIQLQPLAAGDVGFLIRGLLGTPEVSEEFATFVHERTDGVPFAVEEVIRLLQDRQDLVWKDGAWSRHRLDLLDVPGAIRDAIVERLSRLPEPVRAVVLAVAVAGEPVTEEVLARTGVLPSGEADLLCEALRSGLVEEGDDGRVRFRHGLSRDAVYGAISGPERRRLHLGIGRALEEVGDVPSMRLARHFREARAWDEWARYGEQAADEAARVYDYRTSSSILAEVLRTIRLDLGDRVRLARKLGDRVDDEATARAAADVLAPVLDEPGLPRDVRGELRYLHARALSDLIRMSEATRTAAAAVPDLEGRPDLAARALCMLALPYMVDGHVTEHRRWMARAVELVASAPSELARLRIRNDDAALLMLVGDPGADAAFAALPSEAADTECLREVARGRANLAEGAIVTGRYALAADLLAQVVRICEATEHGRIRDLVDGCRDLLAWFEGRWAELADAPPTGVAAALLDSVRGTDVSVARRLEAAIATSYESRLLPAGLTAAAALSSWHRVTGDPARATATAEAALDLIRRKGIWAWAPDVAGAAVTAALAEGRLDRARAAAAELADGVAGLVAPACVPAVDWCAGLVAEADGDREAAVDRYAAAVDAWTAMPRPYDAALARERLGAVLLDAEPERASDLLVAALETFQSLGAVVAAGRVARLLRERGVVLPSRVRGSGRVFGEVLTGREEEVVRLAREGRTNREIAELLSLSRRTVEHHVERALRKLGVRSRAQLAQAVRPG